jgi:tripartite-type tricarboxylate transporter receptor subunit TctC
LHLAAPEVDHRQDQYVAEIIKQPAVREKLAAQLMEPIGSTPEALRARMDGEIARWAPVIESANVKLN